MRERILIGLLLISSIAGINRSISLAASGAPQVSRTSEIYHAGNLIVEGNEIYVIENVTFFIDGNIIVIDSARLIVRNAHITIESHYKHQYDIYVQDSATLEAENTTFDSLWEEGYASGALNLFIQGQGATARMRTSTCRFAVGADRGSTLDAESSYLCRIFYMMGQSNVSIKGSKVVEIALKMPEPSKGIEDVELSGLKSDQLMSKWSLKLEKGILTLENSTVGYWAIDIEQWFRGHLTVKDSKLNEIFLHFPRCQLKINGMHPGFFEEWNLHENVEGQTPWDLTLINTELVVRPKIILQDATTAKVENSIVKIDVWDHSTALVNNCQVIGLEIKDDVYIRFTNTSITQDVTIFENGNFTLEFKESTIKAPMNIECRYGTIKGNVSILITMDHVQWESGTIIREFPLIVEDENGNPIPNVSVSLHDLEDGLIWSGVTDQKGRALFNITFTKENCRREWILKTTFNGIDISEKLGFLASTPIILTLHKLASSISLSVSRENFRKGDPIAISGSINPPLAGTAITITLGKPDGSTFNETILTNSSGSFNYTFIPQDEGRWIVYASWHGDEKYEGTSSSSFPFTVESTPQPLSWELYATMSAIVVAAVAIGGIVHKKRRASSLH